jgi:hypothetical protein
MRGVATPAPPMTPKASKLKGAAGSLLEAILWIAMVGWCAALIGPALAPEPRVQPAAPGAAGAWIGILIVAYFLAPVSCKASRCEAPLALGGGGGRERLPHLFHRRISARETEAPGT